LPRTNYQVLPLRPDVQTNLPNSDLTIGGWIRGISERANGLWLGLVLLLHIAAACVFFPPWEAIRSEPLYAVDYPVHTHRVHVYRQAFLESGVPWGYDPAVSAGTVMNPHNDIGAKPQQVLGLLLPFVSAGAIVRIFLFLVVLTFPVWTLLACRRLGIPSDVQICVMVALITPAWLLQQFSTFFFTGVVGFAAASYFTIYVFVLFISFLRKPQSKKYLAFCSVGALLFLLHPLGPLPLLPSLAFASLTWRPFSCRWRAAAVLAPVAILVLNAFWLLPFLLDWEMSNPAWTLLPAFADVDRHLTYDNWSEFFEKFSRPLWLGPQIAGLILALYGFFLMDKFVERRIVVAFGAVSSFALLLSYFGSFLPIFVRFQPVRFILPAFVFLAVPVGIALSVLVKRIGLPIGFTAAGALVMLSVPAISLGWFRHLPLPPSPDPFANFIREQTTPADRLLVQSPDGYRFGGFETKIFPLRFEREVIGSNFSAVHDPAQFLDKILLGRELKDWPKDELKTALHRWGVSWVFTVNKEGHALFTNTVGRPVAEVGHYRAFKVSTAPTKFLMGDGILDVKVNRIDIEKLRPQDGLVVIRYRYHPSWRATPDMPVFSYPVPEDPSGFIALKDPPETVTLRFDPLAQMAKKWPKNLNTIQAIPLEKQLGRND
jgi:hypothetical protein